MATIVAFRKEPDLNPMSDDASRTGSSFGISLHMEGAAKARPRLRASYRRSVTNPFMVTAAFINSPEMEAIFIQMRPVRPHLTFCAAQHISCGIAQRRMPRRRRKDAPDDPDL
jgi:hypothetical protein